MEIWLDTIDIKTITHAKSMGVLHGVTTNPAILSEDDRPAEEILEDLLVHFSGPLAVQVTLHTASEMVEQGKDLRDFSERIVAKIPVTTEGLVAIKHLSEMGITVMATTIFEPMQALMAAKAGAHYVVPYFSHLGENALSICKTIQQMQLNAQLLVASLKTSEEVMQCATALFDAVTLKAPLFHTCISIPPQTGEQIKKFDAAWQKATPSQLLPSSEWIK